MGFHSLQHIRNSGSTSSRASPARFVPPSGFGYPLDGLLPWIPCRFCFTPAALLGFDLRRFPLPWGLPASSVGQNPPTVEPTLHPTCDHIESDRRVSVSGFAPHGIARRPRGVLGHGPQAPPLVFAPSGHTYESLRRTSPTILSRA